MQLLDYSYGSFVEVWKPIVDILHGVNIGKELYMTGHP